MLAGHGDDFDHRHVAETQNRVTAPLLCGHGVFERLNLHLLVQCAAGGLQHVAVDLVLHACGVDHHAGVMAHHHAADMHLARAPVDLDIGHPSCPGRAKARPFAVHIARVGYALAPHHVTVCARHRLLPGACAHLPACALGGGRQQLGGTRVFEVLQSEFNRVHPGGYRQFVDVAFVGKRIGQGRHTAQPRGPQNGGHVIHTHPQVGVVIGRPGGAVTHFISLRQRLHRAGEQERQCGRAVGGVAGFKIIGRHRTIGIQPAAHVHQLGCALGLPGMFLFARELHPHRRAHGAGQQGGISGHIVGAVAAIAAGRFHADHINGGVGQAHEASQVGAQHMRVLRARPDDEARLLWICRISCLILPKRHGTRWANRAMQLVRPHIGARQTL